MSKMLRILTVLSLQPEERAQFEILKAQMFAERAAKRERRPKRARAMAEEETPSAGQKSEHKIIHPPSKSAAPIKECKNLHFTMLDLK